VRWTPAQARAELARRARELEARRELERRAGALASGNLVAAAAMPAANTDYLYLVGQGTANATYTAGKLLIELYGI
jgi:hypothetical protein